jgi:predicted N-acyltransferase
VLDHGWRDAKKRKEQKYNTKMMSTA